MNISVCEKLNIIYYWYQKWGDNTYIKFPQYCNVWCFVRCKIRKNGLQHPSWLDDGKSDHLREFLQVEVPADKYMELISWSTMGFYTIETCEICELYTLDKLTVMFLVVCSLCTIIAFIPLTAGIIHLGICLGQGKGLRVVWVHSLIKKSRTLSRTLYTCSLCSRLVHSLLKLSIYIISHHHNQPEVAYAMVLP